VARGALRVLLVLALTGACGGLHGGPEDLGDLIFGTGGSIPREKLDAQNEFVSMPKGDPAAPGSDIRGTIGLRHIRTSFFFDEGFLPSEGSVAEFFPLRHDPRGDPTGCEGLPVLAYAPRWLANRAD
jgi:hypothetical protein